MDRADRRAGPALLLVWTFLLGRTAFGRHVYAVGGNDEAARRAGIRVDLVRISVFVVCSFLAAISGIVQMSAQAGVNSAQGGANTLLLAVGAAVIGGTSLFGGRGRVIDAVIGGVVVEVISYGMSDLISGANGSGWQWIITGIVLLLAAGFDAVSRRARAAAGQFRHCSGRSGAGAIRSRGPRDGRRPRRNGQAR